VKKKIILLLCVLSVLLCFTGCGDKKAEKAYDTATLEQIAEVIITNFAEMGDEDFAYFEGLSEYQLNYTMMSSNLPIDGLDFVAMIRSWIAAEEECGTYISHGDFVAEVKNDGVVLTTSAKYENRDADITFSFDEDSNLESLDVSAKFSMGEILQKAGLNTLLGMGTVFSVLIFLAFIISMMKYIPNLLEMFEQKDEDAEEVQVVASAPVVEEVAVQAESDDLELIAVITAAIAAQEGTSTDGFVVRSIRRRPSNNWI